MQWNRGNCPRSLMNILIKYFPSRIDCREDIFYISIPFFFRYQSVERFKNVRQRLLSSSRTRISHISRCWFVYFNLYERLKFFVSPFLWFTNPENLNTCILSNIDAVNEIFHKISVPFHLIYLARYIRSHTCVIKLSFM